MLGDLDLDTTAQRADAARGAPSARPPRRSERGHRPRGRRARPARRRAVGARGAVARVARRARGRVAEPRARCDRPPDRGGALVGARRRCAARGPAQGAARPAQPRDRARDGRVAGAMASGRQASSARTAAIRSSSAARTLGVSESKASRPISRSLPSPARRLHVPAASPSTRTMGRLSPVVAPPDVAPLVEAGEDRVVGEAGAAVRRPAHGDRVPLRHQVDGAFRALRGVEGLGVLGAQEQAVVELLCLERAEGRLRTTLGRARPPREIGDP